MLTIIATVKEEHLGNIRSGRKLFEMRKTCPKEVPFRVLCCQSKSGGEILAEFIVRSPICVKPPVPFTQKLIEKTCITAEAAEQYAAGGSVWFWDVHDMIDYCSTKGYRVRNVSEFGLTRAPQSWCYVEDV